MDVKAQIQDFLAQPVVAVAGVSRNKRKFGRMLYETLKEGDRTVYPINASAADIDGETCYASVAELPQTPGMLAIVLPPEAAAKVVEDAVAAGIERLWIQPGAESDEAIAAAEEGGVQVIAKRCMFMHLQPVRHVHKVHRFLAGLTGSLYRPK